MSCVWQQGSEHGRKFASAVAIAVDVKEALSRRMEHAIAMWRQLETIDAAMLSGIIEAEPLLMFKLVDALLSTPYFPLQQFYFMALSGLLYLLSHSRGPSEARLLQNFIRSIQHFDSSVSKLLPLHEAVDWVRGQPVRDWSEWKQSCSPLESTFVFQRDPKVARKHVNELNKCTHVCKTFKLVKCWISDEGTSALVGFPLFYAHARIFMGWPLTKLSSCLYYLAAR